MKKNIAPKNGEKKPADTRRVHYVLSTHWDREWYQTFQDYRRRLVALMDRVLDDISDRTLKGPFTTDGQSIILDDYLEIRPNRREQIIQFAKTGKLNIGPWYVLPDEWLVSGESIIRNIRLGRQIARDYGTQPSDAGFVCDLFGHIGQLPQLFKGFGIIGGLIWRGMEPRKTSHVLWEGSDGSQLLCYRFGRAGYCDYTWEVRKSTDPDKSFDEREALHDLRSFLQNEASRSDVPPLLVFDGGDHLEYDSDHYRLLFSQATSEEFPFEIVHSTLDAYLKEMLTHSDQIGDIVRGELRESGGLPANQDLQWLIPGVLSSRVWIKQANARAQTLLCQWAEPFSAAATSFLGAEYPNDYLDTSWRWLLQNHPHDSICGCSIDAVHKDMQYRFAQSIQIAEGQIKESLRLMASSVRGEIQSNEIRVLVANPLTSKINEPLHLTLQTPAEWGSYQEFFGFEPKPAFRIFDAENNELPYQLINQDMSCTKLDVQKLKFPASYKTNDITVCVKLPVPALGYTTLTIREGDRFKAVGLPDQVHPVRHQQTRRLVTSERSMANDILSVTIESNGTLTVTDFRTGQTFQRLLTFEDIGDIGDGWFHGQAVNDQTFVSAASGADVVLISNGSLFSQFRIRTVMNVPADYDFSTHRRSEKLAPLVIDTRVGLRAESDRLEICTTVTNLAKDHRLRVLFPTGIAAQTYLADGAFDVVERPVGLPKDNHLFRELAVETTPQQTWTAVEGKTGGLAIVSEGLHESAVSDLPERPIALTLFRSTRRTVLTDGEPDGQLHGQMSFDYWIVPFTGTTPRHRLCNYGAQLAAGFRTAQLRHKDIARFTGKRELPSTSSFLIVKGDVVTTSVRQVGGNLEVRLFNPNTKPSKVAFDLSGWPTKLRKFQSVSKVDLESQALGEAKKIDAKWRLSIKPKKIVTLSLSY